MDKESFEQLHNAFNGFTNKPIMGKKKNIKRRTYDESCQGCGEEIQLISTKRRKHALKRFAENGNWKLEWNGVWDRWDLYCSTCK